MEDFNVQSTFVDITTIGEAFRTFVVGDHEMAFAGKANSPSDLSLGDVVGRRTKILRLFDGDPATGRYWDSRIVEVVPGSSARWLVGATHTDPLVRELGPMAEVSDWRTLLKRSDGDHSAIRQHTRTGRPFGDESFVAHVERLVGRRLHKQKPGPMPKRYKR